MPEQYLPVARSSINPAWRLSCLILCLGVLPTLATAQPIVNGTLTANGITFEFPYVYVWPEKEGFYDKSDPTWNIIFVERELKPREIDAHPWETAWVHIGITESKEFSDQPELQVYTQSIKFSADAPGNVSGGTYPQLEIEGFDSGTVTGRLWHAEPQTVFDDTYQFDISFSAPITDPNAPIGDLLPEGGGEPGQAYLKWVETIHSGDIEALKSIVPAEMAAQFDQGTVEEAREEVEFMKLMTPTDVSIVSGSTDGETAILNIEGTMEGEKVPVEVTMTRMGEFWIPTNSSM